MGCRSDYMEPSDRERYVQNTAVNLVYVLKCLKKEVPADILEKSNNIYAQDIEDKLTPMLCDLLSKMSKKEMNQIVFDGKIKSARVLADWWENHQEVDKKRIDSEKCQQKTEAVKKNALKKLTKQEKEALGIK